LHRAGIIIKSLGGLTESWKEMLKNVEAKLSTVTLDVFIGAAFMTHLGALSKPYRD
jgi:hypothetical protein